jgi:hypothetical protein
MDGEGHDDAEGPPLALPPSPSEPPLEQLMERARRLRAHRTRDLVWAITGGGWSWAC